MNGHSAIDISLAEKGWAVIDLPDPQPIRVARQRLLSRLQEQGLPGLTDLGLYHLQAGSDDEHFARIWDLAQWFWREELAWSILSANLSLFRALLGPDLHGQRYPYLRVVRPGVPTDAAPMHRDTYYGASPYELSILVPFSDMDAASGVRVLSGSHVEPDSRYPFEQHANPDVQIRSPKHQLGYPYAPRRLAPDLDRRAEIVPLQVGQAIVFGLALIHGGGVNQSGHTRFSTDIRIAHSLAPVQWARGVREDYFLPLSSSALHRTAAAYLRANEHS